MRPLSIETWGQCFALEMWNAGFDIAAIDAFLDTGAFADNGVELRHKDGRPAGIDERDTRLHFKSQRERALDAYVRGEFDLAVALVAAVHHACRYVGFKEIAQPYAIRGVEHGRTQRARRLDKPGTSSYDASRNERVRAMHARLHRDEKHGATQQVAKAFDLSERQVRRIVKIRRTQPG